MPKGIGKASVEKNVYFKRGMFVISERNQRGTCPTAKMTGNPKA